MGADYTEGGASRWDDTEAGQEFQTAGYVSEIDDDQKTGNLLGIGAWVQTKSKTGEGMINGYDTWEGAPGWGAFSISKTDGSEGLPEGTLYVEYTEHNMDGVGYEFYVPKGADMSGMESGDDGDDDYDDDDYDEDEDDYDDDDDNDDDDDYDEN